MILVPVYIFVTFMYPHQERKSYQKGKLGIKSKKTPATCIQHLYFLREAKLWMDIWCFSENVNGRNKTNSETDLLYKPINEEIDEGQFRIWLQKKEALNKNIQKVCVKYGETLKQIGAIRSAGLMYDEEHNLLFAHNAKVEIMSSCFLKLEITKSKVSINIYSCGRLEQHRGWLIIF